MVCEDVREFYGLNLQPDSAGAKIVANLHGLSNKSIQRLAADLYAAEVHFVLELLQNADDCSFPANEDPALKISLSASHLEFSSNELGFEKKNVIALCSIGDSTKAGQVGYIGQKGIGFKSVFKVTKRPKIHSRNFHFEFCAPSLGPGIQDDGLGFIIPSPLPTPDGWNAEYGTTVVLPFAEGNSPGDLEDLQQQLKQQLHDIQASLLLFLNKLMRIEIHDEREGKLPYVRKMSKETIVQEGNGGKGLTQIVQVDDASSSSTDPTQLLTRQTKWLVVESILKTEMTYAFRPGVERTKLAIAIPLLSPQKEPPQSRDVHAFLPLRSYGFRFILQGDFVVPSSREAVDASSPWNCWLRENVAELFVDAMMKLVAMSAEAAQQSQQTIPQGRANSNLRGSTVVRTSRAVKSDTPNFEDEDDSDDSDDTVKEEEDEDEKEEYRLLAIAFCMVPLPREVNDFFQNVPSAILSLLKSSEIIPTEQSISENGSLKRLDFVKSYSAVQRPTTKRKIDTYTEVLLKRMGYHFVHPRVTLPPGVAEALGIASLGPAMLFKCLAEASNHWDKRVSADFSSEWLVVMLAELYKSGKYSTWLPKIKQLYIFPTADQRLVRLEDGRVFQVKGNTAAQKVPQSNLLLSRTLQADFGTALAGSPDASNLVKRLGVESMTGPKFLTELLIPALSDERTEAADLISLLTWLKSEFAYMDPADKKGLLSGKKIRLVDKYRNSEVSGPVLHIGKEYDPSAPNPVDIFPPGGDFNSWRTVSKEYLAYSNDPRGWTELFRTLGLSTFVYVSSDAPYHSPELSRLLKLQTAGDDRIETGKHFHSEEVARMEMLVGFLCASWGDYAQVLELIQTSQAENASKLCEEDMEGGDGGGRASVSFLAQLRDRAWIPGTDGRFHLPREILHVDAKHQLGEHGIYCAIKTELPPKFVEDVNLYPPLGHRQVLSLMRRWKESDTPLSIDFMKGVYTFLHNDARASDSDQRSLSEEAVIFVPSRSEICRTASMKNIAMVMVIDTKKELRGQWYKAEDCVMFDKTYMIDGVKAYVHLGESEIAARAGIRALKEYYCKSAGEGMENFFFKLGVKKNPSDQMYLDIVKHAQKDLGLDGSLTSQGPQGDKTDPKGLHMRTITYALTCVLRIFVHWSWEADERDSDEPGSSASTLNRFLLENNLCIPCVGREEVQDSSVEWCDLAKMCFVDDRAHSACFFGCLDKCKCKFGSDLLNRCAKLPPFSCIGSDKRKKDHDTCFIKDFETRLGKFYMDVLRLPSLARSLRSYVHPPPMREVDEKSKPPGSITNLVVALRGLQALSKTMSSEKRKEIEKHVKSLVVIERRELSVCPLAVRYSSLQGQERVEQSESGADGDNSTATKMEVDGNEGSWEGKAQNSTYALDIAHGLFEHHTGEGGECRSESPRGTVIRLFTTDVQFTDKKQISCVLAKIVLLRADGCGLVEDNDSTSFEAADKEFHDAAHKEYRELSQKLQIFLASLQMPPDGIDEARLSQMVRRSLKDEFGANADEEHPWVELRPEVVSGHEGKRKQGSKDESEAVPNLHKLLFQSPAASERDGLPRDDVPTDEDLKEGKNFGQAINRALEKREQENRQRMEAEGLTETSLPKFERHLPDFLAHARRPDGENESAAPGASHSGAQNFSNALSHFSGGMLAGERGQPGSVSGGSIGLHTGTAFLPENPALELQDGDVWVSAVMKDDGPSTWDAVVSGADVASESDLKSIGKWGEQIAFKVFTEQAILQDVLWVNSEQETGEPYDITLRFRDNPEENIFVEVKTTVGNSENCHISWNELNFACEKGQNYWVCRVIREKVSVETDMSVTCNIRVVVYKNLCARLFNSQASLLLNLA